MQNQSKKTVEEKRLEARRALEGEERGRKREEEERKIAEKKRHEIEQKERGEKAAEEKRRLEEKQKRDASEQKLREEKEREKEITEKKELKLKIIEDKRKHKEEEERVKQEALLRQISPPGKKLHLINKKTIPQKKDEIKIPRIKTYKNDAEKAIKKQGESLTKIVLAEKEKTKKNTLSAVRVEKITTNHKRKPTNHKILIIITGFIIMSISSGALIYVYQTNKQEVSVVIPKVPETEVITIPATVDALVTANTEKNIATSEGNVAVLNIIAKELRETSGTGSIKNIYLTDTITTFTASGENVVQQVSSIKKLLSVWPNKMPALLSRSLSDDFMLGIYSSNPGRNMPFLVLTTNSYGQTFAGMFEWENNILYDFYKLFGLETTEVLNSFQDIVIRRNDVRILKDQKGETVLLYSFINKNMLIITTNEEALNKILFKMR